MTLTEQIKDYINWCKKYYYKPSEAKSLKAYYKLVKGWKL